jgi:hypothetical protein
VRHSLDIPKIGRCDLGYSPNQVPVVGMTGSDRRMGSFMGAKFSAERLAFIAEMERAIGMPTRVREAREAVWGLAAFGIAYPVIMGVFIGGTAGRTAALQFGCSWILGLAACGFAGRSPHVRTAAIILAVLQGAMGFWVRAGTIPSVLWLGAAMYSVGTACAVVYMLHQAESEAWFAIPE